MNKIIFKLIAVAIFAVLMTFTLTINKNVSSLSLGISEATADGSDIPCYSTAKRNWNYAYVDCASCNRLTGWRATGGSGTCAPNPDVGIEA